MNRLLPRRLVLLAAATSLLVLVAGASAAQARPASGRAGSSSPAATRVVARTLSGPSGVTRFSAAGRPALISGHARTGSVVAFVVALLLAIGIVGATFVVASRSARARARAIPLTNGHVRPLRPDEVQRDSGIGHRAA